MHLPKVTIITVCYNSVETIEQTIRSVINQTYKNIEYIIVDGNSDDGTLKIIEKYNSKIDVLISESDTGLYHAMNKGIMCSTGEIIGILNSDDWYALKAVEQVVECFKLNDCEVAYGGQISVYKNGIQHFEINGHLEELEYRFPFRHSSVFVKRNVYERFGLFDQKFNIAADYDLMLRFYKRNVKMVEIPYYLTFFRMDGVSNREYLQASIEVKEISLLHCDSSNVKLKEKIDDYSCLRFTHAAIKKNIEEIISNSSNDIAVSLENFFKQNRDYIIWGTGEIGVETWSFLKQVGIDIKMFVDNNPDKWNSTLLECKIFSPEILKKDKKNVIVSTLYYNKEIEKQLLEMGYKNGDDYILYTDMIQKLING